jgi:hypothetical protein
MPLTTNPEEEEIVDVPGNDGNESMPEQVKRPNPWRKTMMMTEPITETSRSLKASIRVETFVFNDNDRFSYRNLVCSEKITECQE